MIYLWETPECPNKHIAEYDRDLSPDRFLLMKGNRLSETEFGCCYVCVRSSLIDLMDDFFVRTVLRYNSMSAYIFTAEEMFCFSGGIAKKINIGLEKIKKLKLKLALTNDDTDKEFKALSDEQLDAICAMIEHPKLSRIPIFHLTTTASMIKKKYDCIPNNSASKLVNQKIIDILMKLAPGDVQFFDAEVHCKDGILTDYKLLNLTNKIGRVANNFKSSKH
ncbi:MAG: hypothetical protein LEGION0403_FIIPPAGN_02774 [Legionella sp.]|uniref:hypothetical protein n=1 Tax=Legionella sp. TaxID=459 RepID=UPI003D0FC005